MSKDEFSNVLQGRAETSGILIALIIGIFGILTLLQDAAVFSWAWSLLTYAYIFAMVATYFAFSNWVWHALYVDIYTRDYQKESVRKANKEIEGKMLDMRKKSRLMKFALYYISSDDGGKKLQIFIKLTFFVMISVGIALWFGVALHCGIGNSELLNPPYLRC